MKRTQANRIIAAVNSSLGLNEKPKSTNYGPYFFTNFSYTNYYEQAGNFNGYLAIGREIQENIGRLQFYYGLDIFARYTKEYIFQTQFFDFSSGEMVTWFSYWTRNNMNTGFSGFVGLKFFIVPRLSFALEAAANLYYTQYKEHYQSEPSSLGYNQILRGKSMELSVSGIRFATINFHF